MHIKTCMIFWGHLGVSRMCVCVCVGGGGGSPTRSYAPAFDLDDAVSELMLVVWRGSADGIYRHRSGVGY